MRQEALRRARRRAFSFRGKELRRRACSSRMRLRRVATRAGVLSKRLVLVVAAPPDARLVASLGGAVEPLVHAPEAVQSARIGGIGAVGDAVLEHVRAHALPLA